MGDDKKTAVTPGEQVGPGHAQPTDEEIVASAKRVSEAKRGFDLMLQDEQDAVVALNSARCRLAEARQKFDQARCDNEAVLARLTYGSPPEPDPVHTNGTGDINRSGKALQKESKSDGG